MRHFERRALFATGCCTMNEFGCSVCCGHLGCLGDLSGLTERLGWSCSLVSVQLLALFVVVLRSGPLQGEPACDKELQKRRQEPCRRCHCRCCCRVSKASHPTSGAHALPLLSSLQKINELQTHLGVLPPARFLAIHLRLGGLIGEFQRVYRE